METDLGIHKGYLQFYTGNAKVVNIPDSVRYIGKGAFSNRKSLEEITIPDSVECIGENAFSGCTNLKKVTMSKSIKKIGKNAFKGTKCGYEPFKWRLFFRIIIPLAAVILFSMMVVQKVKGTFSYSWIWTIAPLCFAVWWVYVSYDIIFEQQPGNDICLRMCVTFVGLLFFLKLVGLLKIPWLLVQSSPIWVVFLSIGLYLIIYDVSEMDIWDIITRKY